MLPDGEPGDRVSVLKVRVPLRATSEVNAAAIEEATAHIDSLIATGVLRVDDPTPLEQRRRSKRDPQIGPKRK